MNRIYLHWLVVLWAGCLLAGCGNPAGSTPATTAAGSSGNTDLAGSIVIEGSSTVEPISVKAKEEFNKQYPSVNISVSGQGTGNGFKALAKKECDVADASRPVKLKELNECLAAGLEFVEIPVAYDGLTIVVNKKNDFVDKLTIEQLTKIFRQDMAAKTWKEVDPAWPDEQITIYAPGIASGTHDYFMEVIGKDSGIGMRDDTDHITKSEDDKLLVTGVKGEPFSIGFFGFSYFEASRNELRAVPIVNAAGEAVAPSLQTIESGQYEPFSRPLFIYVNTQSWKRAEVREFVDFYLANVVDLVKQAGYVPLPADIYKQARNRLDKSQTGTHYLDADGHKRAGGISAVYQEANLRTGK
jgi:phosphate transport system substrate-binding protein